MTPNSNSENDINVWCDWLTDNGQEQLADEIRFEDIIQNLWYPDYCRIIYRHSVGSESQRKVGSLLMNKVGSSCSQIDNSRDFGPNLGGFSARIGGVGGYSRIGGCFP